MTRPKLSLLALLLLLAPHSLQAQVPVRDSLTPQQIAAVDQAVKTEMRSQKAIGVAIGILQKGQISYVQGYGLADKEKEIPVTSQSLFRWASVSKPVTAVAAMQLVEKGRLDLDADVRTYVPEFPEKEGKITVRQLLCHQSGIVHYSNGKVIVTKRDYGVPHPFEDVVLALDNFKESPLIHQPGEKASYTTHGFVLLSAVVERAGKTRYLDQVNERIFKPLGMTTMQPDYEWKDIPNRAVGYRKLGEEIVKSKDVDVSWKLGGGGFISNIDDMARFAQGLLQRKLVNAKTEELMWTPQKTSDGKVTTYGLGFSVDSPNNRLRVSHSGAQEKTRTRLVIYPRLGQGVVVMTNSEYADPAKFTTVVLGALQKK